MDKYSALYEIYPHLNVLDISPTGSGKTTSAIQHAEYLVTRGKNVVVVMQSYKLLEEARNRLHADTKKRTLIFKGKTQEDICPFFKELTALYEHVITSYCKGCKDKKKCQYYKQINWIKQRRDFDGMCIFTVANNVSIVLSIIESKNVTIIVDDVPISYLLEPTDVITYGELEQIKDYLSSMENTTLMQRVVDFLFADTFEIESLRNDFVKYGGEFFRAETEKLATQAKKDPWNEDLLDFKIIYKIIARLQENRSFYKEKSKKTVIFSEDNIDFYRDYRILYLNATPASLETRETTPDYVIGIPSLYELLGDYYLFFEPPPLNENWVILQVDGDDYKYSKDTVANSKLIRDCVEEILSLNSNISKYLGINCLLITSKDVYINQKFGTEIKKCGYNHNYGYYFGENSHGTNKFTKNKLCICAGTPYLSPDYYKKPHYSPVRCDNNYYSVDNDIIAIDSRNEIIQGLSRVLRGNPEICKLGIYFGNIDLGDKSTVNGAIIKKGYSISNDKEKKKFMNEVKKEFHRIYRASLIEKLCNEIDLQLNKEKPIKLDSFVREFIKKNRLNNLYKSENTIKNYIKEKYNIELIEKHRSRTNYIISKK